MKKPYRYVVLTTVVMAFIALAAPVQAGWTGLTLSQVTPAIWLQAAPPGTPQPAAAGELRHPSTPELIAADVSQSALEQETADLYLAYALSNDPRLPDGYRSSTPWDGTLPLLHLRNSATKLKSDTTRMAVEAVLAETCSDSSSSLPYVNDSAHFHIQYGTLSGGLNINSYATSLETTWAKEITAFGWAAPPVLPANPPPGNRYHVRLDNLGSGLYGYVDSYGTHAGFVGNNPNTPWSDGDAYASCMVLNSNYSNFPSSPQASLDATTAHEFNHAIQFGYGALTGANAPDDAFVEGGATWMEDEVFNAANDNYNYLWPSFSMCMGEYTNSPYAYWITLRGLTERYGTGVAGGGEQVMQDFWELTSKNVSGNLQALNTALVNKGANLADAYHAYAIAVKFNKTCGGGYAYPYCLKEGPNYVAMNGLPALTNKITSIGGSYNGSVCDNYALNWIGLPTGTAHYDVTLSNTSSGGQLHGSVVCDTGSTLNVAALPLVAGASVSTTLFNFNPAGCNSVVLVLTNQAQTSQNPTLCSTRSYQLKISPGTALEKNRLYLPYILK
jgi:hypothetical protein